MRLGQPGLIHERFTNFSRCHHDLLSNLRSRQPAHVRRRLQGAAFPRASGLAGRLGAIAMQ